MLQRSCPRVTRWPQPHSNEQQQQKQQQRQLYDFFLMICLLLLFTLASSTFTGADAQEEAFTKTTPEEKPGRVEETPVSNVAAPSSVEAEEEVPVVVEREIPEATIVEAETTVMEVFPVDELAKEDEVEEGGNDAPSMFGRTSSPVESTAWSGDSSEESTEFEEVYVPFASLQEPQEEDLPVKPKNVETEEVVIQNLMISFDVMPNNGNKGVNEEQEKNEQHSDISSSTDNDGSMNAGVPKSSPSVSAVELSRCYSGVLRALYEEVSFASALAWIKLGVAHGHGRMHWLLGVLYANGIGVPQSDAKAILHHTFAALENVPEAHLALGRRYADGIGVTISCEKAVAHYREVANDVARSYDGMPNPTQPLREVRGRRGRDETEAMQLLIYRADEGATDALLVLGRIYFRGRRGIPRDWHRARMYFRNALDRGEVAAYGALGQLHAAGDNTARPAIARDLATAATYFIQGAARNDAASLNGMGYLHAIGYYVNGQPATEGETGVGGSGNESSSSSSNNNNNNTNRGGKVKPDFVTAARYFSSSAELGSVEGIYNLGVLLLHGRGVQQDVLAAIKHFETAALRGSLLSFWQLARIEYGKGNCMRALNYYSRVASFSSLFDTSNDAPYFPWDEKNITPPIVPREGNTLVPLLEALALAEAGDTSSRQSAAELLESAPIMEEPPEALEDGVFAKSGRPPERAMRNDSGVVWLEWYHTPKNDTMMIEQQISSSSRLLSQIEALNMLRLRIYGTSAMFGNPEANLRLGDFYYYGESRLLGSDMPRALMHYEAAASKNNPKALFNMGFMYQLGLGIKGNRNVVSVRDALLRILTCRSLNNNDMDGTETESKEGGKTSKTLAEEEMRLYLAKRYYDRVMEVDPMGSVYAVNLALMSLNFQWWWLYFSQQRYGFSKLLGLPMPFEQRDAMEDTSNTIITPSTSDTEEEEKQFHHYRQVPQEQEQQQTQTQHNQHQQQQEKHSSVGTSSSTSMTLTQTTVSAEGDWSWDDYILIFSAFSLFVLLLLRHHGA
ncbi:Sel1-like repeat [Trypanosoma melophagium]|uniref:Sel1-like repeat n=1 Tax=Trypanosoma melophagium TaxID=715481 RepID=UPI00351AA16C|nr:Sel1-like repeat [Trypanosoma melophagium]